MAPGGGGLPPPLRALWRAPGRRRGLGADAPARDRPARPPGSWRNERALHPVRGAGLVLWGRAAFSGLGAQRRLDSLSFSMAARASRSAAVPLCLSRTFSSSFFVRS